MIARKMTWWNTARKPHIVVIFIVGVLIRKIKLGDWHSYKGVNPLHQLDLGGYIAEPADVNGAKSLHSCVLGAKGVHSLYGGYRRPPKLQPFVMDQDPSYRWLKPAIDNQVPSGWTVYDLRRLRFRKMADVDPDFTCLIYGHDLLIIIPELTPQT